MLLSPLVSVLCRLRDIFTTVSVVLDELAQLGRVYRLTEPHGSDAVAELERQLPQPTLRERLRRAAAGLGVDQIFDEQLEA
ncbi:hypothetical protein [Mucisphaera sp.]|uniref:hypothetical protein n=1 Tax=Mucisphaera sp. TaxID=2913024 RepID=UPI003D135AD6